MSLQPISSFVSSVCFVAFFSACTTTPPTTTTPTPSSEDTPSAATADNTTANTNAVDESGTRAPVARTSPTELSPQNTAVAVSSDPEFVTPSGKIECLATTDFLRCELTGDGRLNPLPTKPSYCDLSWRAAVGLSTNGLPEVLCAGDTIQGGKETTLAYGQPWQYEDFSCVVETTGLTCNNSSGAGFFLSTQRWRPILASVLDYDLVSNEVFGFSFAAPTPWIALQPQDGLAVTVDSPTRDLKMYAYGDQPDVASLSDLIAQERQTIQSQSGVQIHEESNVKVAIANSNQTLEGWRVDYSYRDSAGEQRMMKTVALKDDIAYYLVLEIVESAFNELYLAVMQTANDTFTIPAN